MNQASKALRFAPKGLSAAVNSAVATMATVRAPIAEEIKFLSPEEFREQVVGEITLEFVSAQTHDLDEAVDEIIEKAKGETSDVNDTDDEILVPTLEVMTRPVIDLATLVDFVPVKNKQGRYRLNSDKLRYFIHDSMDTRIVERNMLPIPGDDAAVTAARLRLSVQPLELFYQYFTDFEEITHDDLTASESGLTWNEYQTFFADLAIRRNEFVAKQEAEAKAKKDRCMAAFASGELTFDDLGVALKETALKQPTYVFGTGDQNIAGKMFMVRRTDSPMGSYLQIWIQIHSHNEDGLNAQNHCITINGYQETEKLSDLGIAELVVGSEIHQKLIARGSKYLELTQKPVYVQSKGNMTRKVGRTVEVINAQGRVMIDLEGMTNMDTNYHQYFCKADQGETTIPFKSVADVSDEIKLSCVPYVYGFSFKAKRWGQLNVSEMEPIQFREDAYEMLVLDQKTKDLIFASVTDNSSDNDIIAGKGGGSINLLEGPPGVGKTLTAEAVAEKLKKPLYMVSAGELGTDVNELEDSLKDILEIAATWGAVLLIDEADIFLETRDKHDVHRNAMVAVFLRLLEYYQGVLFLTTNRADNLDPAFESRITLCIHYSDLAKPARKQIWTNLMKAAKLSGSLSVHLDQLSDHTLNGRQIKGIIKSAGSLARFRNTAVNVDHFEEVIAQKADFKAATVFKLGHGLDNHMEAGEDKKPGLFRRLYNVVFAK